MQNTSPAEQTQQYLSSFDCAPVEEQDPCLAGGYRVLYDRLIPLHIRYEDRNVVTQDLPNLETVRMRIFVLGNEKTPQAVKIELSIDSDLYFHYTHVASENNFQQIKKQQDLTIELSEYPGISIKSLNSCEKQQDLFSAIFTILAEGEGHLEIVQTTEYKTIEVISYHFHPSQEELIKRIVEYRYKTAKNRLSMLEGRLQDINEVVRLKNPSLLVQIEKSLNQVQK